MPTTTPGKGADTPARSGTRFREAMARVGIHVRDRVSEPVDEIRLSAQRILSDSLLPDDVRQAAQTILSSADRIAREVGSLEDSASIAFAQDPLFMRPPQAPQPLTNALAGELTHLARQADAPLKSPQVALLKPRLKRAARLANLWLSTTIDIDAQVVQPPRTTTLGPAGAVAGSRSQSVVRRAENRPPERAPIAAVAAAPQQTPTTGTAARALADRLDRLKAQHDELQARYEARENHWRGVIHEIRNAAQAFVSWSHMLRHSEITAAPWFEPLRRAAEALQRRAEEAAARKPADNESLHIEIETFDVIALSKAALQMIRPMADSAGITLAFSAPIRAESIDVRGDSDRASQILHNLLRNAVEATPPGGTVSIAVGANERSAEVEVEDSGGGVPEEMIESLFSGTHPTTPEKQGFGVGLKLSHDLAVRMGSTLDVRPRLAGSGACFVLKLPRAS